MIVLVMPIRDCYIDLKLLLRLLLSSSPIHMRVYSRNIDRFLVSLTLLFLFWSWKVLFSFECMQGTKGEKLVNFMWVKAEAFFL